MSKNKKYREKRKSRHFVFQLVLKSKKDLDLWSLLSIVFLVSIISGFLYYIFFRVEPVVVASSDFLTYLTGATIIKRGVGDLIYDLETQLSFQKELVKPFFKEKLLPFRSPPVVALLFLPFTYFSPITSYKLFAILNLIILIILTISSAKIFKNIKKYKFWYLIPFVFLPSIQTLFVGQTSFILLLIFLFIYISINNKNSLLAGVLGGFILFRPQYIVALPFLTVLVEKKLDFIIGFTLSFVFLLLMSLNLSGINPLLNYPSLIAYTERPVFGSRMDQMFSLTAALSQILKGNKVNFNSLLMINTGAYLLTLYIFIKRYKFIDFENLFVSTMLFSLVFSVHVLSHDLSILMLPVFIWLNEAFIKEVKKKKLLLFLAILVFLIPIMATVIKPAILTYVLFALAFYMLYFAPGEVSLN